MTAGADRMPTLVTGATGTQGGAVARALLAHGWPVRAMVRDPRGSAAASLARLGAELAIGSFEDSAALDAAVAGCSAVFSVQLAPSPADPDQERKQARALIGAAIRADVPQIVHSSVSNTGAFETMAGWTEGRWERNYWRSKGDVEAMILEAGFRFRAILRPAFMMENFAEPKATYMFPDLRRGRISTAAEPDTRIALIAADDIGAMAAAALADPARFHDATIELAGDHCTLGEVAAAISAVKAIPVAAETLDYDVLVARGQNAGWVQTQQWFNSVGYPARPEHMTAYGLRPTTMHQWAQSHAADIVVVPDTAGPEDPHASTLIGA